MLIFVSKGKSCTNSKWNYWVQCDLWLFELLQNTIFLSPNIPFFCHHHLVGTDFIAKVWVFALLSPKNWVFIAICAIHSSHQATSEQGPSTTTKVHLYTFRKEEGRKGCLGNCNGEGRTVLHLNLQKYAKKSHFSPKTKSVKKVYFDETCTFLLPIIWNCSFHQF